MWPAPRRRGGGGPLCGWPASDKPGWPRAPYRASSTVAVLPVGAFRNRNDLAVVARTVPGMDGELSVVEAADYVGVSERGLRDIIKRGELESLALVDVQALHQARRVEALSVLERRRRTPVDLAREVRDRLHPRHLPSSGLPGEAERAQRFRLSVQSGEAKTLFGLAALKAAAATTDGCRWCLSKQLAAADGGWAPREYAEAFGVLLGAPCEVCWPGLRAPVMAALRAAVHSGGVGPSVARTGPVGAPGGAVPPVSAPRAATKPVGDDGGRDLVAGRRREVQARLKAARRRGDARHVASLQRQLRALVADASRVDGGGVASAARPGTLRCGHLLAAGCACPRRASR